MTKALGTTGHLFARKTPAKTSREPTSESIAADLQAFELAGGLIEKLGNTSTLKHISPVEAVHAIPARSAGKAKSAAS